jgi:hypothetical protein
MFLLVSWWGYCHSSWFGTKSRMRMEFIGTLYIYEEEELPFNNLR